MNDKTGGNRGLRRAGALAVVAAVAVLTAACGVVHVHVGFSGGSAPIGPAAYQAVLAYAHCMQTHGVPNFPDPHPSQGFSVSGHLRQGFSISGHLNGNATGPLARANNACKHMLPTTRT